jgi:hypothetical protein
MPLSTPDRIGLYDMLANHASLRNRWWSGGARRAFHMGTSSLAISLHLPVAGTGMAMGGTRSESM